MTVYGDEIDLRPYLFALRKNWWRICLVAVLGAGAAFVFSILQQVKYEAKATILVPRTRSGLSLAEQFPTISEPIDFSSRIQAMVAIAGSDSVLLQALAGIQQEYPDRALDLLGLNNKIDIESKGDVIQVTVSDTDPEFAAYVANSLAQHIVTAITYAYKGESPPDKIQVSLDSARMAAAESQTELEAFLKVNQIDALKGKISETQALLDGLVANQTWQTAYQLQRMQKMEQVLDQATLLKEQLRSAKTSPAASLGDALAVLRLYSDAFWGEKVVQREAAKTPDLDKDAESATTVNTISSISSANGKPGAEPVMNFDVQVSQLIDGEGPSPNYQRDLEEIVARAEEERSKAEANLIELARQSTDPDLEDAFALTARRLGELTASLEAEEARLTELENRRDLDRNAFQALAQKETEIRNNLQTSSSVVLASSAVLPQEPASRGVLRNTIIAGALGFILGILWVLASQWKASLGELGELDREQQSGQSGTSQ